MEAPDLYYTDASWTDRGTISEGVLDLAYGDDENDFELTVDLTANYPLANGSLIYAEGTDIGGMVDEVEPDTIDGTCAWRGRTWHGILAGNIVAPDAGEDYWTAQGDANAVLRSLVSRLGLGELFAGASGASGITVNHDFRYVDAYQGVRDMLAKVGAKLHIAFDSARRRAVLSAEPISDDTADDEWDGDVMDVRIVCDWRPVNHLVCLGKGELKDRLVVHYYADEDGKVSTTQTIFGSRHVAAVYDYSNAERADLEKEGRKKLEEMQDADEVSVSIPDGSLYDIGDRVGGRESHTGIFVTATVVKKIVHIRDGEMSVEYEAGMASTTGELHLDAEHTSVTGAQLSQVVEAVEAAQTAAATALDSATLTITSTNGNLFKNGAESTVLQVAVFPNGGDRLDTIEQVRARFGSGSYIEWKWKHENGDWGTLPSSDPHLSQGGMWLTVTPEDVADKTSFSASLVTP